MHLAEVGPRESSPRWLPGPAQAGEGGSSGWLEGAWGSGFGVTEAGAQAAEDRAGEGALLRRKSGPCGNQRQVPRVCSLARLHLQDTNAKTGLLSIWT